MSRDGSGIYHLPSGLYPQAPNTTIESGDWNNLVADLEQDANTARPIVAGGTGAGTVTLARTNLQAERAMQIVTNYDTQVWENGSFYSPAAAVSAPNATDIFSGTTIVLNNDPNFILLQARSQTDGRTYVRRKVSGTWAAGGAWQPDTTQVARVTVQGAGQANAAYTDSGNSAASLFLADTGGGANNGGALLLGAASINGNTWQAAIKSVLQNGAGNGLADLSFELRAASGDTNLTERMRISSAGTLTVGGVITSTTAGNNGFIAVDSRGSGGTLYVAASANGLGHPGIFSASGFDLSLGANNAIQMTINTAGNTFFSGVVAAAGGVRVEGAGGFTGTGNGIELLATGGAGIIQAFNRTSSTYGPLDIYATAVTFKGAASFTSSANDGITINGGAGASSTLLFSTNDATAGNRNWAIRNRFNALGMLEFSMSSTVGGAINTLVAGFDNAGQFKIFTPTASSSPTTGALAVSGGVGIGGALNVAGQVVCGGLLNANASANITGDIGVTGKVILGGSVLGFGLISLRFNQATNNGITIDNNDSTVGATMILFSRAGGGAGLGSISNNANTGIAYNTTSDRTLKKDAKRYDRSREMIDALEVWDYQWKDVDARGVGMFAQDVHELDDRGSLVTPPQNKGDPWMINLPGFVPYLVADAKDTHARLDAIEKQLGLH